jgi:hypothetical protein
MNVTNPLNSRAMRLAKYGLDLALRFWPEDSRHWGQALAAELPGITQSSEVVRWALGGLSLFLRATGGRFLAWMKLRPGVDFAGQRGSPPPRLPRFLVALLLLATASVFLIPQGREAVSTVRASWNGFQLSADDEQNLEHLTTKAEKQNDAAAVAFVALSISDSERSLELKNRAVALDPHLIWIFSGQRSREIAPQAADQMQRLRIADPDNAFVYLIAADEVAASRINAGAGTAVSFDDKSLFTDPVWVSLMERAFHAPRYDSYSQRQFALARDVGSRHRDISVVTLALFLGYHRIPQLSRIKLFAEHQIRQAEILRSTGSPADAENILTRVSSFGDAMALGSETDIEKYIGLEISSKSLTELRALYASAGRFSEADRLATQISTVQSQMYFRNRPIYVDNAGSPRGSRRAAIVQFSGFIALASLILSLVGLTILELRSLAPRKVRLPFEPLLRLSATYAPAILFLSSLVFLISFQPFARIIRDAMSANPSAASAGTFVSNVLALVSTASFILYTFNPYYRWLLCTALLSALVLYLVFRTLLSRKSAI